MNGNFASNRTAHTRAQRSAVPIVVDLAQPIVALVVVLVLITATGSGTF